MLRLRSVNFFLRRILHVGTVNRDQVLEQLSACSVEDQVFDVVGKNKAKLTINHVSGAMEKLWGYYVQKPGSGELIKSHPQFLTLCVMAENNIELMDDVILVDMISILIRLDVKRDSLIQQLVSEAWLRIERLPLTSLSTFASCLKRKGLNHSPLMGHITRIVDQRLSSINDIRILAALMSSVASLTSPRLRDALRSRASDLLDNMDPQHLYNLRKIMDFLYVVKYRDWPLLRKCNKIILHKMPQMEVETITMFYYMYQSLQFHNRDFIIAVRQRLTELMDSSTTPHSFTYLFKILGPMANQEIGEWLEDTALLLVDELSPQQALDLLETLTMIRSKNRSLLSKTVASIQRDLHVYGPKKVSRICRALYLLQYENCELFTELRNILVNRLDHSIFPNEVMMLTHTLLKLPNVEVNKSLISRVNSVVTQCSLKSLNRTFNIVAKRMRNSPSLSKNTLNKYMLLLKTLHHCGCEKLRRADRLDLLLAELYPNTKNWFDEMLLDTTLQRMMDQINWTNVHDLAHVLAERGRLFPPLMERIANVVMEDINKIDYTATYAILLSFLALNYYPVQADALFDVCVQHLTPHISSFDPHELVVLAYSLAVANCIPEELVREIFSIDCLGKLDAELEALPTHSRSHIRSRLMELNRAVCIQCPEFQVPWFHDSYCKQRVVSGSHSIGAAKQQIHKTLGEVLGGIQHIRSAVLTPYFYTVDFECILDKHMQPLNHGEPSTLQISDRTMVHWGTSVLENIRDELPPGAQRVAVLFLTSASFVKNSHLMKGECLMKKRHLEIMGYRVVEIPHFEWHSMERSTQDAQKEYLKKKIFGELSS